MAIYLVSGVAGFIGSKVAELLLSDGHTVVESSRHARGQSERGVRCSVKAFHYLYDLDVTVLRYFTVYGPAGRPDMSLFRFTQWIRLAKTIRS